jgi:hypothetical protein
MYTPESSFALLLSTIFAMVVYIKVDQGGSMPDLGEFCVNAVLCDSAVVAEGKLYMQGGGWNLLGTQRFPFNQPRISLAAVVSVPYTMTNQNHSLEIKLETEDHKPVPLGPPVEKDGEIHRPSQINAQFNIGRPPILQPGDSQVVPFAVNIDQLQFDSPSAYSFVFSIDGTEIQRLSFRVLGPPGGNIGSGAAA